MLDVLRGIAICGTLGSNIWLFMNPGGPAAAVLSSFSPGGVGWRTRSRRSWSRPGGPKHPRATDLDGCTGERSESHVFQNLAASILCYGWGFGLAVRLDEVRPWSVLAIWALIVASFMVLASLWLRRFDRGPLETLWQWAYEAPWRHHNRRPRP